MSEATSTGSIVTGAIKEKSAEALVLKLLDGDYQLHLVIKPEAAAKLPEVGKRVSGQVYARARRVDVVTTGGRFIEPVMGRPRRVQGRVIGIDIAANTLTVRAACPMVCLLTANQKADSFAEGMMVSFDVERGATFEPESH